MKVSNLKAMTLDGLITLRDTIERLIPAKIAEAKRDLQSKLQHLDGLGGGKTERRTRQARKAHALKGRKLAPKYRGPKGETWAGRGMRPLWLTTLMKKGHKADEYAVGKTAAARKKTAAKRSGRKRK